MTIQIPIDDRIYAEAKSHAQSECRTIAGQIEFWAKVGKAALDNPDLPIEMIRELLIARAEGREQATRFVPEGHRNAT